MRVVKRVKREKRERMIEAVRVNVILALLFPAGPVVKVNEESFGRW